jgi:drug/metabolite transporter (DMT)-like permease
MTKQTSSVKVYAVSLIFSTLVGFTFLFTKLGVGVAAPLALTTFRFDFAVLGIVIALLAKIVRVDFKNKPIKNVIPVALFYGAFVAIQAWGLSYATTVEGGIIFAIIPVITMIIATFILKEKTTIRQKFFVILSVFGVILMFFMSAGGSVKLSLAGLFILFLSSVSMSLCNVLMRRIRHQFTPTEISFVIVMLCTVLLNIANIGQSLFAGTLSTYFIPLLNVQFLISVIYLGVLCTFITSLLMSYMLAHMEAVKASLFGNLSTAISIVAGVMIFKEPLQWYHIVCTALIIVGVVGTSLSGSQAKRIQN